MLREIVVGIEYVPEVIRPQLEDVVTRALAAGAHPPLTYIGAGMTGVVFCDRRNIAYKVARATTHPIYLSQLSTESEWLYAANRVPWVRDHVARLGRFHPGPVVIERECVAGKTGTWGQTGKLHDLHREIERLMLPYGWTSPEFKEDSYVIVRGRGPVLVDASMPLRVGRRLVEYALDVLAGRRPWFDDRPQDLAFYIRREAQQGTIPPQVAAQIEARLKVA